MNTSDRAPSALEEPTAPQKHAYQPPRVTDLGDVRHLTQGTSGHTYDGPGVPATGKP